MGAVNYGSIEFNPLETGTFGYPKIDKNNALNPLGKLYYGKNKSSMVTSFCTRPIEYILFLTP
ncbi:hypothetical protein GCM10007422_26970 [Pedobacter zeae]|uniref:Uncharacterized protein n=1 Tax=Pedobacter zeae TaxID=1737356 RepID=A0ABQ1Y0U3_9SPHI|nr:hypothetical protein GCM10007422_26970 [Pedobacter zeae]